MIIHLYRKGITTQDIADLIEKIYGCYYTRQTISNITSNLQEQVEAFHQRQLEGISINVDERTRCQKGTSLCFRWF